MLVVVEWEDFARRLACVNPAGEGKKKERRKKKRQCSLSGSGELNLHGVQVVLGFPGSFFGRKKSTSAEEKRYRGCSRSHSLLLLLLLFSL